MALKTIHVLHHSVHYISWFFGVHGLIRGSIEDKVPLEDLLGGMTSVALTITAHEHTQ